MRNKLTLWAARNRSGFLCLLLALLAVGPGGCTTEGLPTRKQVGAAPSPTPPSPPPPTTDELVVYLDTSSPMKGYVQTDGKSMFSKTLLLLRAFTAVMSPPVKVQVRKVDSVVGPLLPSITLSEAATSQAFYNGAETNLVAAFASFTAGLQPAPVASPAAVAQKAAAFQAVAAQATPPPAATPGPPARFHVLITDGVQYSKKSNNSLDCASGADQYCVQQRIFDLLRQGWGGAVIGLRSQFCCNFFSEQSQRYVPYSTQGRELQDQRPFYLYVFSPDRAALSDFVTRFKESLRRAVGSEALVLRELALTSRYAEGETASQFKPDDFETGNREALRAARVDGKEPFYLSLRLKPDSRAVDVPFKLKLKVPWTSPALDSGSAQELASLLQWSLEPTYPGSEQRGKLYPEIKLAGNTAEDAGDGRVVVSAVARWPQGAGDRDWRAYRLAARLSKDSEGPPWVSAWSTDDDRASASGNRTLDLKLALLGVWRNEVLSNQNVVEAYLRIGPQ
jgi:hypothetical protein